MSTARANIMGRLKASLDKRHNPTVRISTADQRIKVHAPGLIPKRGQSSDIARATMFADEAERVSAVVVRVDAMAEVPGAVKKAADGARLKIAPNPKLQALDWSDQETEFGIGHGDDPVGLSMAYAGVAETGTLVLRASASSPTTLNFLPDTHMVVIRACDIEASYEGVWTKVRADATSGEPMMPRTLNWITGPSRTADIEQTILLGAHGPRKLVIILVDETD